MKSYLELTKSGIVFFVLMSGAIGYALSLPAEMSFSPLTLLATLTALYFLSSGSFALNQAQEWRIDARMPRTRCRPVACGKMRESTALLIGISFIVVGLLVAYWVRPVMAVLGLVTVALYNLLYTLHWKRKLAFGAVPGALPGAMPVVIGYVANTDDPFTRECAYAFLIMFLWQMPHFWALAIRYKDDYARGGIPVLPLMVGTERTLYHMGLYVFAYVALAVATPWFAPASYFYLLLALPFAFKVLYEFYRYQSSNASRRWLPFFLWINLSMLAFLMAPVLDKWHLFWLASLE